MKVGDADVLLRLLSWIVLRIYVVDLPRADAVELNDGLLVGINIMRHTRG